MRKTVAAFFISMAVLFSCAAAADLQQRALASKMIRLHVVGASDSKADQELKIAVKDEIVKELSSLLEDCETVSDAEKEIRKNLDLLGITATEAGRRAGKEISAVCTIKTEPFPTKGYDTFSLPAGYYKALKVEIDEAQGQNWWCVVFPAVCTDAVTEKADFESFGISEDEAGLITMSGGYTVKFKFIELIEKLKISFLT